MSTTSLRNHMHSKIKRIYTSVANFILLSLLQMNSVIFSPLECTNSWTIYPYCMKHCGCCSSTDPVVLILPGCSQLLLIFLRIFFLWNLNRFCFNNQLLFCFWRIIWWLNNGSVSPFTKTFPRSKALALPPILSTAPFP